MYNDEGKVLDLFISDCFPDVMDYTTKSTTNHVTGYSTSIHVVKEPGTFSFAWFFPEQISQTHLPLPLTYYGSSPLQGSHRNSSHRSAEGVRRVKCFLKTVFLRLQLKSKCKPPGKCISVGEKKKNLILCGSGCQKDIIFKHQWQPGVGLPLWTETHWFWLQWWYLLHRVTVTLEGLAPCFPKKTLMNVLQKLLKIS